MTLFRRFLVLFALLAWQGGGVFYAGVVVPIGRRVLHDQIELQTVITRDTTWRLNWMGVGAVLLLALDLETGDPSRRRRWLRAGCWAGIALSQLGLLLLHARLSTAFAGDVLGMAEPASFYRVHRVYLWTSAAQFALALAFLALSLAAWRGADRRPPAPAADPATQLLDSSPTLRLKT
jgi:hypothetical protein